MSDNEDNIFDDDNSVDLETEQENSSNLIKKNNPKITIQSDNDDSDFEDEEIEKEEIEEEDDVQEIDEDDEDIDIEDNEEDIKDDDEDEFGENDGKSKTKKTNNKQATNISTELPDDVNIYGEDPLLNNQVFEDNEEDEDPDENYLQKFENNIKENYVSEYHPETNIQNYEEIVALSKVVRDKNNNIVDPLHKTIPILTKYERTRVIGQRTKQIENGAKPYISVPENIIDGHLIAELELEQKRIPFIIRRPLPGGAGSEYWSLSDLEILTM